MQASACSLITLLAMSFSVEMGTGWSNISDCDTEECKMEDDMSMSLLQTLSLVSSDSQALTSPTNPSNRASQASRVNRTALVSMPDRKEERCPEACVESGADDEYKNEACRRGVELQPGCSDSYQEEDGGWAQCPRAWCDACFGCTPPQPSQGAPCPPLPDGVVECQSTELGPTFSSTDFDIDPTWICRSLGYDGAKLTSCSSTPYHTCKVGPGRMFCKTFLASGDWVRKIRIDDLAVKIVVWKCEGTKMCSPTVYQAATNPTENTSSHEDNSDREDESLQSSPKCPNGYNSSDNSVSSGHEDKSNRADESLQSCGRLCDASRTCQAFEFSATPGWYLSYGRWKRYEKCYTFNGNYQFQKTLMGKLVKHPSEWQTCIRID